MIVAIFGTTISPYLFFWQSSEEVEDVEPIRSQRAGGPSRAGPEGTQAHQRDTYVGMGFST